MRVFQPLAMIGLYIAILVIGVAVVYFWIQLTMHFYDVVRDPSTLLPKSSLPDCPNSKLIVDCLKGGK